MGKAQAKSKKEFIVGTNVLRLMAIERQMDIASKKATALREEISRAMISLGANRVEVASTYEALRYPCTSYKCKDSAALEAVLRRFLEGEDAIDQLLPRAPAATEIRKVIEGKAFPRIAPAVRKCCTKKTEWKLKVGKMAKKAKRLTTKDCA